MSHLPQSFEHWSDRLLEIWEMRPPDQKFQILCVVHHVAGTEWLKLMYEWVRRGVIRIVTISEQ
jgi:hypothetical protein